MKTKEALQDGEKLERQYRNVQIFPGDGKRQASLDEENRIVRDVSVSSDEPYERWYGTEVLLHEKKNVDLTRVESNAAPLLYNHDRDASIGKISNPRLKDGKLYVDFKFSAKQDAIDMLADLKDGILTECSIGYDVNKFEVDEDEETYTATLWTLYEVSLVTIPADFTVGVGRDEKGGSEVEIRKIEKNLNSEKKGVAQIETGGKTTPHSESENQRTQHMPPEAVAAAPVKTQAELDAEKRAADQKIKDGIKAARKREEEIRAIAKRATVPPEKKAEFERSMTDAIEKAADDDNAPNDFRTFVFENFYGNPSALETPDSRDADLNGNVLVVGDRSRNGRGQSIGAQFVASPEFREKAPKRGIRRSVGMDFEISILGIRGKVAMAQRAFASSDLAPVNVQIQSGMIGLGMQRLTIMDLIAPGATGAAAIIYPRENSFGSVDGTAVAAGAMPRAKAVGERGIKPIWEPDLTTETANVKKIAVRTKVPDEFMADFPQARSYIDERLPFMVDTETEFQILYGDGLNNNLKGIFTNANVQTRAILTTDDSTIAASLKKGLTDISVNSFFEPDAFAFHPYDWETAQLLKDDNKRFLAGGPFYIPYTGGVFVEMYTFWGKPCVVTTAVNYGRPLAGAWKLGAQYFVREGMRLEMTNANEDDFNRNLISIRAEHRLGLATYRPLSFLEFTGFPART
jgi:HK97 family phage prohead protease/HK97 family phage major capsid protein